MAPLELPARPSRMLLLVLSVYSRMSTPASVSSPLSRPLSGAPLLPVKRMSVIVPPGAGLRVKALLPVLPAAPV